MPTPDLKSLLKSTFGYDAFRPLQEEIIDAALAGRDVMVLMPTGGGKSLCYQLPALARDGLTIVVSPLIALMKDQVDALQAAGAPATFLNSTLDAEESRRRIGGLHRGEYKLLYIAPERLMLSGTQEMLESWKPQCIAIDEAHCISEWGHDFRPEYRQLADLRHRFGQIPMMALTATATDRVRVNYHGTLLDGTVFDSSYQRNQPAEFMLNQVIPGWTEGVSMMPVGAKYRFWVPSQLGYGERGAGGQIGPNATLVFDVELLAIAP